MSKVRQTFIVEVELETDDDSLDTVISHAQAAEMIADYFKNVQSDKFLEDEKF